MQSSESPKSPRVIPRDIAQRLESLPMLPAVFGELIALDASADDYSERVCSIAEREPALAAKLLSVANAALMGSATSITTLDGALVRMGARRVASLVTTFLAVRLFAPITEGQRDLWRHALQTSVAASEIAAAASGDVVPQSAFVAGLLHDIGRLVLFEDLPEDQEAGLLPEWNRQLGLIGAERAACGSDHCEVGMLAGREWGLPRELWAVLRLHHHHAELDGIVPGHVASLVRVVRQADALSDFLMRPETNLAALDAAELEDRLAYWAIFPGWGAAPLGAGELAAILPRIVERSAEQLSALSLG